MVFSLVHSGFCACVSHSAVFFSLQISLQPGPELCSHVQEQSEDAAWRQVQPQESKQWQVELVVFLSSKASHNRTPVCAFSVMPSRSVNVQKFVYRTCSCVTAVLFFNCLCIISLRWLLYFTENKSHLTLGQNCIVKRKKKSSHISLFHSEIM